MNKMIKCGRPQSEFYNELGFKLKKIDIYGKAKYTALCRTCSKELKNTSRERLETHRRVCKRFASVLKTENEVIVDDDENIEEIKSPESTESKKILILQEKKTVGRPYNKNYKRLGFEARRLVFYGGKVKNIAHCLVCSKILKNTSAERLVMHRRVCQSDQYGIYLPPEDINFVSMDALIKSEPEVHAIEELKLNDNVELSENIREETREESNFHTNFEKVTEAAAKFIYSCNIPFAITESIYFKNFVRTLNANCISEIPRTESLSGSILQESYSQCLEESKTVWYGEPAVLIINAVELTGLNSMEKYLVAILHSAIDGLQAFLDAIKLEDDVEYDDSFNKLVMTSIGMAKDLYCTTIYAIVTDKIINKQSSFDNVWYITCQSHIAALLLKDIMSTIDVRTCLFKAKCLVDDLKKVLLEVHFPNMKCDTDVLSFLVSNWFTLKKAISGREKTIRNSEIINILCDRDFKISCLGYLRNIKSIQTFIKKTESKTCSLVEAMGMWMDLMKKPAYEERAFTALVVKWLEQAVSVFSLAALSLHPCENVLSLSASENKKVNAFFESVLPEEGLQEYARFHMENGDKPADDALNYWQTAAIDMPNLAKLAIKLLKIPASSGRLREVFSNFSKNCAEMDEETCRKLMHVYFHLKSKESGSSS